MLTDSRKIIMRGEALLSGMREIYPLLTHPRAEFPHTDSPIGISHSEDPRLSFVLDPQAGVFVWFFDVIYSLR